MTPIERVKLLAERLKTIDPALVRLNSWKDGNQTCLAGHATRMAEFNEEGFGKIVYVNEGNITQPFYDLNKITKDNPVFVLEPIKTLQLIHIDYNTGTHACVKFFGTYFDLFATRCIGINDKRILNENPMMSDYALATKRLLLYINEYEREY